MDTEYILKNRDYNSSQYASLLSYLPVLKWASLRQDTGTIYLLEIDL